MSSHRFGFCLLLALASGGLLQVPGYGSPQAAGQVFSQGPGPDNLVVMEAENFRTMVPQGGHDWTTYTPAFPFSGTTTMRATPDNGVNNNLPGVETASPRMDYIVNFKTTGTYYVWILGLAVTGAGDDDSIHAGLDGVVSPTAARITGQVNTGFTWCNNTMDPAPATITVATAGLHTFSLWMREDGNVVDKILLTTSAPATYTPTGMGPAEATEPDPTPAAPVLNAPTNDVNAVILTWNQVALATGYNIFRSGTSGGPAADPYVKIGTVTPGSNTTYTDSTATFPNTYYYVVQAFNGIYLSPNSNEQPGTPIQAQINVTSTPPLVTTEAGGTATFNIVFNSSPATPVTVTVTSNSPTEGLVGAPGLAPPLAPASQIQFVVNSGTPTIAIVVTGVPDNIDDGNTSYTVTVSTSSTTPGFTITSNLNLSNTDIDTAGVTVTPSPGGLIVDEQGPTSDTFTIRLNSIPTQSVTFQIKSSDPTQATVSPPSVTFLPDASALNNVTITVTAVDDQIVDLTQQVTIQITQPTPSLDSKYAGFDPPDQVATVLDNEPIPELKKVWGCGFVGLEALIPLGAMALWRRRRRNA
jgi:hypothetical protein